MISTGAPREPYLPPQLAFFSVLRLSQSTTGLRVMPDIFIKRTIWKSFMKLMYSGLNISAFLGSVKPLITNASFSTFSVVLVSAVLIFTRFFSVSAAFPASSFFDTLWLASFLSSCSSAFLTSFLLSSLSSDDCFFAVC